MYQNKGEVFTIAGKIIGKHDKFKNVLQDKALCKISYLIVYN